MFSLSLKIHMGTCQCAMGLATRPAPEPVSRIYSVASGAHNGCKSLQLDCKSGCFVHAEP